MTQEENPNDAYAAIEKQHLGVIDTLVQHQKLFAETAEILRRCAEAVGYQNLVYDRRKARCEYAFEATSHIAEMVRKIDWLALAMIGPTMVLIDSLDENQEKDA